MSSIVNAITFDVEDYFMVSAFDSLVTRDQWASYESRVTANTKKILSVLKEYGVSATFFILGWVAEHYPGLVREITKMGHEVACHGYDHRLIYGQTPDEFRLDIRKAKKILESIVGVPVIGYRAPSFSLVKETLWATDILREEGIRYDSSIVPAQHSRGGILLSPIVPYTINGLIEFPISVIKIVGISFPYSGGGYFRLFPYSMVRRGISCSNHKGWPVVVYLHPWELDPDQPRFKLKLLDKTKHYLNLSQTEKKLKRLLMDFRFGTVREVLVNLKLSNTDTH